MENAKELSGLLKLEKIEENIFRGNNYPAPWGSVFGGQVLAQALHAAYQTVPEDRLAHSMHAYFILRGDISQPIIYDVDRIRDGGSFTTRRVVAIQKGRPIFNFSASFQLKQEGFDHQMEMPKVPNPESLLTDQELAATWKGKIPETFSRFRTNRPIEFRPVEKIHPFAQEANRPFRHVWFKAKGKMSDSVAQHQTFLAYASDYNLLGTALLPHRHDIKFEEIQLASLDHGMWFHREFRMDDWLLYALDSPSSSNSRGFTRGNIFSRDGKLVASVVQEGMIRKMRKKE
ncbi:acyl-CoA thioesterase II [Saprospiraceae bacterium]|jgi:acyl-CoA thioesterase-2|nr:acyl-CoA thioesterase II [Saprospiraceae bacterium]MDG1433943.1 acyl-CoA thioesterase II [Saprospiraceae bacterium]